MEKNFMVSKTFAVGKRKLPRRTFSLTADPLPDVGEKPKDGGGGEPESHSSVS